MRGLLIEEFKTTPKVMSLPDPVAPKHGAIIKVEATGLCRSDWHGWQGHDADITLPHVPGHEFAGEVIEVGDGVRSIRVGDRVTIPFVSGCGHCGECHAGQQQICPNQQQPGFTYWGSFAEYVAVHQADLNLVRLPDDIDYATAASLGCRFATSFRALIDKGRVRAGEWVAVHGCGGVGLSAVMIGTAAGANVIAVDISDEALALAKTFGAVATVNARDIDDVPGAIHQITRGGAHLSMDALGHQQTCVNSILCLRRSGRHLQVGLLAGDQARPAIPMDRVIAIELELLGSHGMQAHRYDAMLDMITRGKLDPSQLVDRQISLDAAPQALTMMGNFTNPGATVITAF